MASRNDRKSSKKNIFFIKSPLLDKLPVKRAESRYLKLPVRGLIINITDIKKKCQEKSTTMWRLGVREESPYVGHYMNFFLSCLGLPLLKNSLNFNHGE